MKRSSRLGERMSSWTGLDGVDGRSHDAWRSLAWQVMLVGGVYFLAAAAGILLSRQPQGISSIWLANALALGWFLRRGTGAWPLHFVAIFASGLAANILFGHPPTISVVLTAANLFELGLALGLLRLWTGPLGPDTLTVASYLKLQAVAAAIAPAVAGVAAAVIVNVINGWAISDLWWLWWSGSAIGAVTILPIVMTADRRALQGIAGGKSAAAFIGFALLSVGFAYAALTMIAHPFVVVGMPLVLAALWTTPFATALNLLACMAVVTVAAHLGQLVGVSGTQTIHSISINFFAALTIFPAFCISLIVAELRREQVRIGASELRFRQAMEHSAIGMALIGLDGSWQRINRALSDMLGYMPEELGRLTFQDITHPADLAADLHLLEKTIAG